MSPLLLTVAVGTGHNDRSLMPNAEAQTNHLAPPSHPDPKRRICSYLFHPMGALRESLDNQLPVCLINITTDVRSNSESNNSAASQVTVLILWNSDVHYRVHNSPQDVFIPCNINPVHTLPYYLCKIHINFTLISTSGSFKRPLYHSFPHENPLSNSILTPYVPHASPISYSFI